MKLFFILQLLIIGFFIAGCEKPVDEKDVKIDWESENNVHTEGAK